MVSAVYVARHGLRANDLPPPTGIGGDVRISEEGEFQARELAGYLSDPAALGGRFQAIYCSPFYRCLQTVTPTSQALGMPIKVETGIGEYYHVTRPTHPVPLPAAQSKQVFAMIDLEYVPQVPVSPDGETLESLSIRVKAAIDAILAHADANGFDSILLMTHAATKIKISEVLTGTTVRAGTCSLDKHERIGGKFVTVVDGLTSFLSGGEQMHWSFDMAYEAGSAADEASRPSTRAESAIRTDPAAPKNPESAVLLGHGESATAESAHPAVPAEPQPELEPEEPMATVYVPLDASMLPLDAQPEPGTLASAVEIDRLESDRPLAKIGSKLYEGQWSRVMGTELYVSPEGEPVGQAEYRIQLQPVEAEEQQSRKKLTDRIKEIDRQKGRPSK